MSNAIQLSIVFPTFNRTHEVIETLKLLKKNAEVNYEVIILDNSPDSHDYQLEENEKYFFLGENLGTAARNIGIEKASAPYIMMLDDDSHPLPGSVRSALNVLDNSPEEIAGITGPISRLDGGLENPPLLPTAFHGCGAIFRSDVLKSFKNFYPEDFRFYGEEYWSTLLLFKSGHSLKYIEDFKVCHRMSSSGRDKAAILYRLSVNNLKTWRPFLGKKYLDKAEFDTSKRYELISQKEGVAESYEKAMKEKVSCVEFDEKMSDKNFEKFSLIENFKKLLDKKTIDTDKPAILCGCGKFPTIWADLLKDNGIKNVSISDFNPGLIGKDYGGYTIIEPKSVEKGKYQFICGHSARVDTQNWLEFLRSKSIVDVIMVL
jgi:GT2 family glycosyltransferase